MQYQESYSIGNLSESFSTLSHLCNYILTWSRAVQFVACERAACGLQAAGNPQAANMHLEDHGGHLIHSLLGRWKAGSYHATCSGHAIGSKGLQPRGAGPRAYAVEEGPGGGDPTLYGPYGVICNLGTTC